MQNEMCVKWGRWARRSRATDRNKTRNSAYADKPARRV